MRTASFAPSEEITFGLRQLVDVTIKALSPGINDPTTAQDAIFHTAAVVSELLRYTAPPSVLRDGSRCVVMAQQPSHRELVELAYDEPRRAGAMHPTVCLYLLATLESLIDTLEAAGLESRTAELHRQARLVAAGCGNPDVLDEDVDVVRAAYHHKFGAAR